MTTNSIDFLDGLHCETVTTGTLLMSQGIKLSEPMLFGLGEGLGFIYWNMKSMDYPFYGGRVKPDLITENLAKNLQLNLFVHKTRSRKKAWKHVKDNLNNGDLVGLKLDSYYLEYFKEPVHFAAHYCAIYDYDDHHAYLIDTRAQGGKVKTSLESLENARAAKGPMSSSNLSFTLDRKSARFDLEQVLVSAIRKNARTYLNPPITNLGYKGILKAATLLEKWFENSPEPKSSFRKAADLMENGGTGGALFRSFYRDFLKEAYILFEKPVFYEGFERFGEISTAWSQVSTLFNAISDTQDISYVHKAADILRSISQKEKSAMEFLSTL